MPFVEVFDLGGDLPQFDKKIVYPGFFGIDLPQFLTDFSQRGRVNTFYVRTDELVVISFEARFIGNADFVQSFLESDDTSAPVIGYLLARIDNGYFTFFQRLSSLARLPPDPDTLGEAFRLD